MKQEIKAKWLEALRSGEYKQGRGVLRHGDYFCCLGVLCDLAVKEGVIPPWTWDEVDESWRVQGMNKYLPPASVVDWAGVESPEGFTDSSNQDDFWGIEALADSRGPRNLPAMNDRGSSFEQIADLIEKHF